MGRIKISGNSTMKFDPDLCEFHVKISVSSGTSGDTLSRGKYRTEEVLRLLNENAGIDIATVRLYSEDLRRSYNPEDGYYYNKEFSFVYQADNRITELITSLLENMADVEYGYDFVLSDQTEKEAAVMSAAVDDARAKAERIAASLNTRITGYEEIKYEYSDEADNYDAVYSCAKAAPNMESLASKLKNPKIAISKSVEIIWITE